MNYLEEWGRSELWFKISERKIGYIKKSQILCSVNKFYKRFQMTKITGSVFSMTYKKIENISRTSIALLNGVNCKVSTTTHEDLHNALRHQAGKDWIGTLKIIGIENTEVQQQSF